MPATAKLYETDPYVQTFTATVLVCTPAGEQFAVQLDRTAFYPEGGGQPCDTGALGTALVTDVQEHGGVITHTVSAALPVGQTVEGRIDWARRRDHMEQHTGEHILSGTLHRLFGAENVGFHIGSPAVRMDMSVPLTAGQLAEAEAQSNAEVRVWVTDRLEARTSTGAVLRYKGEPAIVRTALKFMGGEIKPLE